ncbi:DNA-binding HxlR family transcriptional regulator [Bradyrhizobium sp. LM6.10]
MKWGELEEEPCSMARTIGVIGDRWTLMILRECFLRTRRFEGFQSSLGITRHLLAERLKKLVRQGVLRRIPYQDSPKRHEYILTQKGLDLYPIMMAIVHWGDTHMVDARGRPLLHQHRKCGKDFDPVMVCSRMRRTAFGQGGSYPPRPRCSPHPGNSGARETEGKDPPERRLRSIARERIEGRNGSERRNRPSDPDHVLTCLVAV